MEQFVQAIVFGLAMGSIYGVLALGFVIILKATDVFNVAQGGLVMMGGYACYIFSTWFSLPLWLAVILTFAFCCLLGLLIERVFIRPVVGQPPMAAVMITIGLVQIIAGVVQLVAGIDSHSLPTFLPKEPLVLAGVMIPVDYIFALVATLIAVTAFVIYFKFTKSGLAMRAVALAPRTAQSLGIEISKISATAWVITGMAAAAGAIILATITSVNVELSSAGMKAIPAIALGGLESLPGAFVGGVLIGMAEAFSGTYLSGVLVGVKELAPFVILMLVLLIRPSGLFGHKKVKRI